MKRQFHKERCYKLSHHTIKSLIHHEKLISEHMNEYQLNLFNDEGGGCYKGRYLLVVGFFNH